MKEFFLAICILVAAYLGLNFYNKTNSVKKLDLSSAISQCTRNLDEYQCSVNRIMEIIKVQSIRNLNKPVIWNVQNNLVDMSSGQIVALNISELNPYQLVVWNSYLADSKRKQEKNFMNEENIFGIGVFIVILLAVLWVMISVVPFIWRFFLNRVSEVSKAVKGERVD
jgi:uncharacterized membrane protein YdbT with pleckstrin-like domain